LSLAHADVQQIAAIVIDGDDRIFNPVGARGIGELPMVGVAAAVANAVYQTTGVRVRDLPIRLEDVLA
jgi:xanthine dehydrogenase YagR molybdenum-binding subunit